MLNNKNKLVVLFLLAVYSINYAQVEFDGAYLQTKNGKFIELRELQAYNMKISKYSDEFSGHFKSLMGKGECYLISKDLNKMASIHKSNFRGIVIKGQYMFLYFSLHPLVKKRIGNNETIAKNNGQATENTPYFTHGTKIDMQKKL